MQALAAPSTSTLHNINKKMTSTRIIFESAYYINKNKISIFNSLGFLFLISIALDFISGIDFIEKNMQSQIAITIIVITGVGTAVVSCVMSLKLHKIVLGLEKEQLSISPQGDCINLVR